MSLYSVETEDFHSETPGTVTCVYVTPDASGIDKVEDALNGIFKDNPALESVFRSSVEWKEHNDFLARVVNMVSK